MGFRPPRSTDGGAPNLLERVPRRARKWEEDAEGRVTILEPRYGSNRIGRWIAGRLRARPIRIRLDDLGSTVWKACDGASDVAAIVARLRTEFGDAIEPAHDRLATFLRHLERNRFIEWS